MSAHPKQPSRVLVVGATSAIAGGAIRAFAAAGARLFLAARDPAKLEAVAADLRVRGAPQVETAVLDVLDTDRHAAVLESAAERLGGLDVVLLAHGTLPDQRRCQESVAETIQALEVNCISAIALLTVAANYFERQRAGCLAVITSVAGDRGRQSNYVYGAAKGALRLFLQGLRNRLHGSGVAVVEIKPGFVATPMTAHLKRNPLFAEPEAVGRAVHRAIVQRRDVVYVPWFWRPVMFAIRLVPERIFKRLRL
ncbi:MAG TPA: SDR family oxidoreductase [Gemmatimonadales bacterium]|nr:SDR family oxidoreductase [Gemmatimonadales bacterium]